MGQSGGDDGYFAIAYGKGGIGSSLATVTGWELDSIFNKNHFYDEAGHTNQMSISDTNFYSGSAMALFPIEPNEIPQAVEFWTNDAAIVSFEIYEQFNGTEPINPVYQSSEINIATSRYQQIKIKNYMEIPEGSEIAVVLNVKIIQNFFLLSWIIWVFYRLIKPGTGMSLDFGNPLLQTMTLTLKVPFDYAPY
jgi:hypothetical protein